MADSESPIDLPESYESEYHYRIQTNQPAAMSTDHRSNSPLAISSPQERDGTIEVDRIEVRPNAAVTNHATTPRRTKYQQLVDGIDGSSSAVTAPSRLQRLSQTSAFQILVAGAGFACDAYDLFIMNLVIVVMSYQYSESKAESSLIADAVLAGSVVGQLLFGILADHIGRRIGFISTLSLLTFGATLSACSFSAPGFTIFQCLAIWRFILGIGIGGEYPLAATVTSEASPEVSGRGRRVAAVFSMQGFGSIIAPLVILLLLWMSGPGNIAVVWRVALAIGALPGLGMIYFRLQMKESKVFTQAKRQAEIHASESEANRPRFAVTSILDSPYFARYRELKNHWRDLLGTAGSWFIFDVIFYANGLFSSSVLAHWYTKPDGTDGEAVHSYLVQVATATLMLGLCALPGYWCSVLAIDVLGRRRLQLVGYAGMILSYSLCGVLLPVLTEMRALFFALYGLTFFFCNFGPNVSTFVIPSEVFPTGVRATAHGLSAAAGKMGAVLGGAVMPMLLAETDASEEDTETSLSRIMYVCAGISVFGAIWTLIFTRETQFLQLSSGTQHDSHDEGIEMQAAGEEPDDGRDHAESISSAPASLFSHVNGVHDDEQELSVAEVENRLSTV